MTTTTHSTALKTALIISIIGLTVGTVSAVPKLDGVSYDPGFISAGDRVNISANLHETNYPGKTWSEDKKLKVVLKPGNRLTREYVTIEDDRDESIGFLYPNGVWNQRFQVKVDSGAPTGMYDFELHIQYLKNGEAVDIKTEDGESNVTIIREFSMPVDNEGVDISANVVKTQPTVPRPGDNYVEAFIKYTNKGNKPLEEIEIRPETPENIETAYSQDEKFYINQLNEGLSAKRTLTVNLEDKLEPGVHQINLSTTYEDESGNPYTENLQVPIRVEGRPDLEIVNSKMEMLAGASKDLHLKIKNTGAQDAESVTARIIAERSQPFSLEDRSNYIGEIEAGETGEAVLRVSSDASASMKTHKIKVELRANGDSEEGDNSVYTYTENAEIEITGQKQSSLIYIGIIAAILTAIVAGYRYFSKRGEESGE
ncbi:MAG: COG1361 S-layer family protein [Candidatus Nanohaloarchaea archaeon]